MSQPNAGIVVDQFLTEFALSYANGSYIADRLFRVVRAPGMQGKYRRVDPTKFLQEKDGPRAPDDPATRVDTSAHMDPYRIELYNHEGFVPLQSQDRAAMTIALRQEETENLTDILLLRREVRAAALATNTANFGGTTAIGSTGRWEKDTGNPIKDIRTAMQAVRTKVGQRANKVCMSATAWDAASQNAKVLALQGANESGGATQAQFASYLGIPTENLIIGDAVKNNNPEGQDEDIVDVWAKSCQVVLDNPGRRGLTWGAIFVPRAANKQRTTRRAPVANPEGEAVYVDLRYQLKVTLVNAGHLLTSVIT